MNGGDHIIGFGAQKGSRRPAAGWSARGSVAIAWDEIDRILVECGNGGLVLRFRLIDIDGTLARMAPLDRRRLEAEWFGHPPISINLNGLAGSVGAQLQAIARLMPSFLPALNVRGSPSGS